MPERGSRRKYALAIDLAVVVVVVVIAMALVPVLTSGSSKRQAVPQPAADLLVTRDVVYAVADGAELKLDIYEPAATATTPRPMAVFIHGGGWRAGDKTGGAIYLRPLVREGYLCFSVNYRLSGQASFPAQIHDCKAAIRWIRAHAEEYGGDPARIAVAGASAGAHLAALLGMSGGDPELEGALGDHLDVSSEVQAVADWFGPSDLRSMGGADISDWHRQILEDLFGDSLENVRDQLRLASPVIHIDSADPPVLIIHGDADETVSVRQSRHFAAELRAGGVEYEYIEVSGGGHGKFRTTDPDHWELIGLMVEFFNEQLGHNGRAE